MISQWPRCSVGIVSLACPEIIPLSFQRREEREGVRGEKRTKDRYSCHSIIKFDSFAITEVNVL